MRLVVQETPHLPYGTHLFVWVGWRGGGDCVVVEYLIVRGLVVFVAVNFRYSSVDAALFSGFGFD